MRAINLFSVAVLAVLWSLSECFVVHSGDVASSLSSIGSAYGSGLETTSTRSASMSSSESSKSESSSFGAGRSLSYGDGLVSSNLGSTLVGEEISKNLDVVSAENYSKNSRSSSEKSSSSSSSVKSSSMNTQDLISGRSLSHGNDFGSSSIVPVVGVCTENSILDAKQSTIVAGQSPLVSGWDSARNLDISSADLSLLRAQQGLGNHKSYRTSSSSSSSASSTFVNGKEVKSTAVHSSNYDTDKSFNGQSVSSSISSYGSDALRNGQRFKSAAYGSTGFVDGRNVRSTYLNTDSLNDRLRRTSSLDYDDKTANGQVVRSSFLGGSQFGDDLTRENLVNDLALNRNLIGLQSNGVNDWNVKNSLLSGQFKENVGNNWESTQTIGGVVPNWELTRPFDNGNVDSLGSNQWELRRNLANVNLLGQNIGTGNNIERRLANVDSLGRTLGNNRWETTRDLAQVNSLGQNIGNDWALRNQFTDRDFDLGRNLHGAGALYGQDARMISGNNARSYHKSLSSESLSASSLSDSQAFGSRVNHFGSGLSTGAARSLSSSSSDKAWVSSAKSASSSSGSLGNDWALQNQLSGRDIDLARNLRGVDNLYGQSVRGLAGSNAGSYYNAHSSESSSAGSRSESQASGSRVTHIGTGSSGVARSQSSSSDSAWSSSAKSTSSDSGSWGVNSGIRGYNTQVSV